MKFSAAIFASAVAALAAAPSVTAFAPAAVSQIQKTAAAAASTLPSSTLFMAEDVSPLPLNCSLEHVFGQ